MSIQSNVSESKQIRNDQVRKNICIMTFYKQVKAITKLTLIKEQGISIGLRDRGNMLVKTNYKLVVLSKEILYCSHKLVDIRTLIYYSNFDKHKCTYFHWAQCNEPTTLTLGNLRCFSLISTKFAVVIATALSYRFKC